ncbi:MAG: DUF4215 domain-containing protein [Deltaproteobacteria bacterium]|nr:DUF4215 domain-containing protein [Deltaproteobacteria bacterium]
MRRSRWAGCLLAWAVAGCPSETAPVAADGEGAFGTGSSSRGALAGSSTSRAEGSSAPATSGAASSTDASAATSTAPVSSGPVPSSSLPLPSSAYSFSSSSRPASSSSQARSSSRPAGSSSAAVPSSSSRAVSSSAAPPSSSGPLCGNGQVDPGAGEVCDTAIPTGAGACPSACADSDPCTTDQLDGAGTCAAVCRFLPVGAGPLDACCPGGANANTDLDCAPVCPNNLVEPGEQCDDGNYDPTDGCDACLLTQPPPGTAFRFTSLALRDPHILVSVGVCFDATDDVPFGLGASLNSLIDASVTQDQNGDGFFDWSPTLVFLPLDATGPATALEFHTAICAADGSSCSPSGATPLPSSAVNGATTCLAPTTGTTHPYQPPVDTSAPACFSAALGNLTLDLGGLPLALQDARVAATYVGAPPDNLTHGLLLGFLPESTADALLVPQGLPLVGGQRLSSLLPGGNPPGPGRNCATWSDVDNRGTTRGWWFYFNFTAVQVPWSG